MDVRLVGQLIGLFTFDVGYEIDLPRAQALVSEGERETTTSRRRAAPAHLAYATPPVRAPLGTREVRVGSTIVTATASARIHEFGAVTILLQSPLDCALEALPGLTSTLAGVGPMEIAARELLEQLPLVRRLPTRQLTPLRALLIARPMLRPATARHQRRMQTTPMRLPRLLQARLDRPLRAPAPR